MYHTQMMNKVNNLLLAMIELLTPKTFRYIHFRILVRMIMHDSQEQPLNDKKYWT